MFRDCYFEYAGQFSGDYNLIMAYAGNSNEDFDSGGKYEVNTDSAPATAESILYSLNYSDSPLEFDIEILNIDEAIPFSQAAKIKDWLFGQDGWKILRLESEDYQDYYLKCLLIPETDIVDGLGLRGFRCTLKNISGFWYGEDKTITFSKAELNKLDTSDYSDDWTGGNCTLYLDIDSHCPTKIFPKIKFKLPSNINEYNFQIHNYATTGTGTTGDYNYDFSHKFNSAARNKELEIDTKYMTLKDCSNNNLVELNSIKSQYDSFCLLKGLNRITLRLFDNSSGHSKTTPQYISFTYTPMYRLGGF